MSFSPVKPNIGGVHLKSNFSAKGVATQVGANRSSAAAMVKGGYSMFGTNALFTPANRMGGTPKYMSGAQLSRAFNGQNRTYVRGGTYLPTTSGVSYNQNITQGMSSFDKGMAIATVGLSVLKTLGDMGVFNKEKPQGATSAGSKLMEGISDLSAATATTVSGSFTSALSGADSFSKINSIEQEINQKKETLGADYKNIEKDIQTNMQNTLGGDGVQEGLKLAGVEDIKEDSITVSELNKDNLEECITTVDNDINTVGSFKTTTLPQAKNKISAKAGQINGTLTAKQGELERLKAANSEGQNAAQIQQLEKEIEELNTQKKQLEAADKAIQDIQAQCEDTIQSLKNKKDEISDMKKTEDGMKDKKYDLAKSQDDELKKNMDEIAKINKEIADLQDKDPNKYNKKDENRASKMNTLIARRTSLYDSLGNLVSSLSAAGETSFTNSKNKSYTIKNLEKAQSMLQGDNSVKSATIPSSTSQVPEGVDDPKEIRSQNIETRYDFA